MPDQLTGKEKYLSKISTLNYIIVKPSCFTFYILFLKQTRDVHLIDIFILQHFLHASAALFVNHYYPCNKKL